MTMIWNNSQKFPDEINENNNRFSTDVLVFIPSLNQHSIGWFDYEEFRWNFLSNERLEHRKFFWRYFINEIDRKNHE